MNGSGLRAHRKHQAEIKMANRLHYTDHGLVFAREIREPRHGSNLGAPFHMSNLGKGEYARLIAAAGVKAISFHGLRHTSASLLLQAGQSVTAVSKRLGHAQVSMTLDVYAHVFPEMEQGMGTAMNAILRG